MPTRVIVKGVPEHVEAFWERYHDMAGRVADDFMANPQSRQRWPVFPAARIKKMWGDYGKHGIIRDEAGLHHLTEHMIDTTHRLQANTEFSGHEAIHPHDFISAYSSGHDRDDWTDAHEDALYDHIADNNGQMRISDYAMKPLMNDALELHGATHPEHKLRVIDRMLNRIHPRGDIASYFIEGGAKTLSEMSGTHTPVEKGVLNTMPAGPRPMPVSPHDSRQEVLLDHYAPMRVNQAAVGPDALDPSRLHRVQLYPAGFNPAAEHMGQLRHTITIPDAAIYDLGSDPNGHIAAVSQLGYAGPDHMTRLENRLHVEGWDGYRDPMGGVVLFHPIDIGTDGRGSLLRAKHDPSQKAVENVQNLDVLAKADSEVADEKMLRVVPPSYNHGFRMAISGLPRGERVWDPNGKAWLVHPKHKEVVDSLMATHFPHTVATNSQAPIENEQVQLWGGKPIQTPRLPAQGVQESAQKLPSTLRRLEHPTTPGPRITEKQAKYLRDLFAGYDNYQHGYTPQIGFLVGAVEHKDFSLNGAAANKQRELQAAVSEAVKRHFLPTETEMRRMSQKDASGWIEAMRGGFDALVNHASRLHGREPEDWMAHLKRIGEWARDQHVARHGEPDAEASPYLGKSVKVVITQVEKAMTTGPVAPKDPWHSHLERTLTEKMPNRMPAEAVHGLVRGAGVNQEELHYSKLPELLESNKGRMLSKDEVLSHVQAHVPKFNVVKKIQAQIQPNENQEPKYAEYQLPGAEPDTYEEHLLTLPQRMKPSNRYEVRGSGPQTQLFDTHAGQELMSGTYGRMTEEAMKRNAAEAGGETPYKSSHWDEPNVVAHVRLNERSRPAYTPEQVTEIGQRMANAWGWKESSFGSGAPEKAVREGLITPAEAAAYSHAKGYNNDTTGALDRSLHIEEIQSDWHQDGKKEGYGQKTELPEGFTIKQQADGSWRVDNFRTEGHGDIGYANGATREEAIQQALKYANTGWIPDAPWKKEWDLLALKHAITEAVKRGHNKVTWTHGDDVADRFDLSQQVSMVRYNPSTHEMSYNDLDGNRGETVKVAPEELHKQVGKEIAEKLLTSTPDKKSGWVRLIGDDLKIGGEGIKSFYNKTLPALARDLVGQWGGEVGQSQVPTGENETDVVDGRMRVGGPEMKTVHHLTIPPELRQHIMERGTPLWGKWRRPVRKSVVVVVGLGRLLKGIGPDVYDHEWSFGTHAQHPSLPKVYANIDATDGHAKINEWSSFDPGKGHTVQALKSLRRRYPRSVTANGIGSHPDDSSWQYWVKMHGKGLVDRLLDDEGNDVTPVTSKAIRMGAGKIGEGTRTMQGAPSFVTEGPMAMAPRRVRITGIPSDAERHPDEPTHAVVTPSDTTASRMQRNTQRAWADAWQEQNPGRKREVGLPSEGLTAKLPQQPPVDMNAGAGPYADPSFEAQQRRIDAGAANLDAAEARMKDFDEALSSFKPMGPAPAGPGVSRPPDFKPQDTVKPVKPAAPADVAAAQAKQAPTSPGVTMTDSQKQAWRDIQRMNMPPKYTREALRKDGFPQELIDMLVPAGLGEAMEEVEGVDGPAAHNPAGPHGTGMGAGMDAAIHAQAQAQDAIRRNQANIRVAIRNRLRGSTPGGDVRPGASRGSEESVYEPNRPDDVWPVA